MGKRVFIGSSTEQKQLASRIARGLSDAGFDPVRWWEAFQAGQYTLDAILIQAKTVDGAVLICGPDDRTWYRGVVAESPRDNVLLEFGVFVGHLDRQKTVIVSSSKVKLPTDLLGLTYQPMSQDESSTAEDIVEHFKEVLTGGVLPPPSLNVIHVEVDPRLADSNSYRSLPADWHQRALYVGQEGTSAWVETANSDRLQPSHSSNATRTNVLNAVDHLRPNWIVSLGPGDAERDRDLVNLFVSDNPLIQYIPVDLSEGLLYLAIRTLNGRVRVPTGIVADFEGNFPFIRERVRCRRGINDSVLYVMLGNNLGNLDEGERSFMTELRAAMSGRDRIIIEVATKQPWWSFRADPRTQHRSYNDAFRRLLANGINAHTKESIKNITAEFEDRISFDENTSDVPDATAIDIVDHKSNRRVLRTCRYNWRSLLQWVGRWYHVEREFEVPIDGQPIGMGVMLLQPKEGPKKVI